MTEDVPVPRKKFVGTGMTRREELALGELSSEELDKYSHGLARSTLLVAKLEAQQPGSVLREYTKPLREWCEAALADASSRRPKDHERDSREWYAASMLDFLHRLYESAHSSTPKAAMMMTRGYYIGEFAEQLRMKFRWEPELERLWAADAQKREAAERAGDAQKDLKEKRYAVLKDLAYDSRRKLMFASDKQQLRILKELARKHDSRREPDERLFHRNNRLLSTKWFEGWLGWFRHKVEMKLDQQDS